MKAFTRLPVVLLAGLVVHSTDVAAAMAPGGSRVPMRQEVNCREVGCPRAPTEDTYTRSLGPLSKQFTPLQELRTQELDAGPWSGASVAYALDGERPLTRSYEHRTALRRLSAADKNQRREEKERESAGGQKEEQFRGRREELFVGSVASPYLPMIFFQTLAQRWAAPRFAAFIGDGNEAFEFDGFEFGY